MMKKQQRKMTNALLCGILGCFCFGGGDWLMIGGDTAHSGAVAWLTEGASRIGAGQNGLAMALAFPGIILYGIALFALVGFLHDEKSGKTYQTLTAFGLTPWLCLHLFYIMILYAFAWLSQNGYAPVALPLGEAMASHFGWIVPVSEALMLPPFFYWAYALLQGRSAFPRWMAIFNPLVLYGAFKLLTLLMPEGAFRLAFTNGLMSESMAVWFGGMLFWHEKRAWGRV